MICLGIIVAKFKDELQAHLKAAYAYAELSYAKRLKVGCLIIKDGRVVSIGRNGMPSGGSNDCEEYSKGLADMEKLDDNTSTRWKTRPEVIHAEMNAIAFAAKKGSSTENCIMVLTDSPCFECSKLIIQSGIKEVYYDREYRLTDSLKFLKNYNIKVERIYDGSI